MIGQVDHSRSLERIVYVDSPDIKLSTGAVNALKRNGIGTINHVRDLGPYRLAQMQWIGAQKIKEIEAVVALCGGWR